MVYVLLELSNILSEYIFSIVQVFKYNSVFIHQVLTLKYSKMYDKLELMKHCIN